MKGTISEYYFKTSKLNYSKLSKSNYRCQSNYVITKIDGYQSLSPKLGGFVTNRNDEESMELHVLLK